MMWSTKIVIRQAGGASQSISSVAEAEAILLDNWRLFELQSLGAALKACLLCNQDPKSTEFARSAFERAALLSGILLREPQ
ncbi:DUF982 domain-containing protein [Bacillus subtilis]